MQRILIPVDGPGTIRGVQREGQTTVDTTSIPIRVDSCYSYAKHRSFIQRYWPQHYQPDSE